MLTKAGCAVDIWRTTYYHVMDDAQAIIHWLKATGLRPFLAPLDVSEQEQFLAAYHQCLITGYPARQDGKVLLAFPGFSWWRHATAKLERNAQFVD